MSKAVSILVYNISWAESEIVVSAIEPKKQIEPFRIHPLDALKH